MTLNLSSDAKIALFISIVDKKDYVKVECHSGDSIQHLKQLINNKEDKVYESNDQILVYRQQTLNDSQKIEEYKIKNGEIIFMYSHSKERDMKHKSQKVKLPLRESVLSFIDRTEEPEKRCRNDGLDTTRRIQKYR